MQQKIIRLPLISKSTAVTTDGYTSSIKKPISFPYPLVASPSLIILALISRLNFNQFALNHATVSNKLLMRSLITLPVQDELHIQDEYMLSS